MSHDYFNTENSIKPVKCGTWLINKELLFPFDLLFPFNINCNKIIEIVRYQTK